MLLYAYGTTNSFLLMALIHISDEPCFFNLPSLYLSINTMSAQTLMVDCHKIIKWLEDRKKLPSNWYNFMKASQQKLKLLLKETEQFTSGKYPQLKQALETESQNMSYHDISRFVECLLQTELAQEKSLLFGYSDKRVKDWTNLKKFMENKGVDLVSNAKYIEQSLKFDLPSLNKNIEMMDGQLSNLQRKIDFNQNTIFQQEAEVKKEMALVGLDSKGYVAQQFNIESQIPEIISNVPQTIRSIEAKFQEFEVRKYFDFYKQSTESEGFDCQLGVLAHFLDHQNDFLEVFQAKKSREAYQSLEKYRQFTNWKPQNEWEIVEESSDAKGLTEEVETLNSLTILEDRLTRQELLNNLQELQFFYKGVLYSENLKSSSAAQKTYGMTSAEISKVISGIQQLVDSITHRRLLTPLELKNNKKSYQHFISKFNNFDKNIQTLKEQIVQYKQQIDSITAEREKAVEKLRRFRQNIVSAKKMEESLLSKLIGGGKEVKIIGEINKLQ